MESSSALPILRYRKEFVEMCKSTAHAVVLVSAATGSGKTTQLPQYILDDLQAKRVCVTQPRRVAAITLAKRVSFERKEKKFGYEEVGYRVRFQNQTCKDTRLIFSTDGLLLREAMHDPTLSSYDYIVLDEVHERSLNTDLLFGVVKRALQARNSQSKIALRVVVMSATVDIGLFQTYFSALVLQCEGRQHPVDVLYLKEGSLDRVQDSIQAVLQIHKDEMEMGGILLFMSGKEEIESVCRALEQSKVPDLLVCPLHASLPHELQLRAFERAKPGIRKIVVCEFSLFLLVHFTNTHNHYSHKRCGNLGYRRRYPICRRQRSLQDQAFAGRGRDEKTVGGGNFKVSSRATRWPRGA